MPNKRLHKSLKKFSNNKEEKLVTISGELGLPLGGQKLVEVPNRKGFVYVRLKNNTSEVIQAYNSEVATIYGLAVLVARSNNIYKVIGRDLDRYKDWGNIPYLPRHGGQHSFNQAAGMGADVVWTYSSQFMPLLGYPSGSNGSNGISIAPYIIRDLNGNWKYVGNTGTPDISIYRPSIATGAIMVLVCIDTTTGNPLLLVGSGTTFHAGLTGSSDIARFIPPVTNPNYLPDTAVRLVTGTTQITWTNLYDVRPFLQVVPTGSAGGGSSINTGTLDARYLMLDASNDPVTGKLDIIPTQDDIGALYLQTMGDAQTFGVSQYATGSSSVSSPVFSVTRSPLGGGAPTFDQPLMQLSQDKGTSTGTITGEAIDVLSNGTSRFNYNPSAQGTGTVFRIDGDFTLSSNGLLLLLKNNGVSRFYVNASGTAHSNGVPLIKEAPVNGLSYVRKNAGWEIAVTGSAGGTVNPPVTGSFVVQDDGRTLGSALILNAGTNLTASISGTTALLEVNPVYLQTDDFTPQINGLATTFGPTTFAPNANTSRLYYNGVRQRYTFNYTVSGSYVQTLFTPTTGSVLLLDYNEFSNSGSISSAVNVQDEGVFQGTASTFNFVGQNIQTTVTGGVATVVVTGSSSVWTQVINESGASFSNFTGVAGTWSSDGTVIKQTDTAASERSARYITVVPNSTMVASADIQIRTGGANHNGGIIIGFSGLSVIGSISVQLRQGNADVSVLISGASYALSLPATINANTWYTLKLVSTGGRINIYLDGTLLGTYQGVGTTANASYFGLYTFTSEVWFRNIQAWSLATPI